jgi:hypothetical protein
LNKLPKSQHSKAKRALQEIWMAETKNDALTAFESSSRPGASNMATSVRDSMTGWRNRRLPVRSRSRHNIVQTVVAHDRGSYLQCPQKPFPREMEQIVKFPPANMFRYPQEKSDQDIDAKPP